MLGKIGWPHACAWALLSCLLTTGCALTTGTLGPGPAERPAPPSGQESAPRPMPERAGSAGTPSERGARGSTGEPAGAAVMEPAPEAAAGSPSLALLEQSRSQRAAGEHAAAASSVERALRIDPNNAALWLELGEIKLAEGDPAQAEMMARKALTLAGRDARITAGAERLLTRAASCARSGC